MFEMFLYFYLTANPAINNELVYVEPFATLEACEAAKPEITLLLENYLTQNGLDVTTITIEPRCEEKKD